MTDPELTRALVGMGEGVAGREWMRKKRRIEIEADAQPLGPIDPAAEMLRIDGITRHALATEVAVGGVQVEAVRAGDQRQRFSRILPEFVSGSSLAGIVPRRRKTAADLRRRRLEPTHIVSLPAMNGDRNRRQCFQSRVSVNSKIRILLPREVVGRLHLLVGHVRPSFAEKVAGTFPKKVAGTF